MTRSFVINEKERLQEQRLKVVRWRKATRVHIDPVGRRSTMYNATNTNRAHLRHAFSSNEHVILHKPVGVSPLEIQVPQAKALVPWQRELSSFRESEMCQPRSDPSHVGAPAWGTQRCNKDPHCFRTTRARMFLFCKIAYALSNLPYIPKHLTRWEGHPHHAPREDLHGAQAADHSSLTLAMKLPLLSPTKKITSARRAPVLA